LKSAGEYTDMTTKENHNWVAKVLLFAGLIEVVVGLLHFTLLHFVTLSISQKR
jgi:hypothetical protein